MQEIPGFDVAVGPCRLVLQFFGAWPDPELPQNIFSVCRFLTAASMMFFIVILAQTTLLFKVWNNFDVVSEILTVHDLPIFIALMKLTSVWYNRKVLRQLVILMKEDWENTYSQVDAQTMWENAKFGRQLSLFCLSSSEATAATLTILSFLLNIKIKNYSDKVNYVASYFPYEVKAPINYEITWLGQMIASNFGALSFSAVDGFFAVLVMHVSGQLTILCRSLMKIINDYDKLPKDFNEKVANIVNRHYSLNKFAQSIEDTFNIVFLVQMIVSSVTLCLQGYQIIMILTNLQNGIPILDIIHMVFYTIAILFSVFLYCFVAEELRNASASIEIVAYNSNWYKLPPNKTKLLLFFMHRSQKPLAITAGKFCEFSLELYCSILKSSGGYLSMLLAVKDRLALNPN